MTMRKVLSMILAAAMVLGMVVCAGAQQAKADEESGSITLGIWPEDTQTEAIAVHTNSYVPAFNALHPNVEAFPLTTSTPPTPMLLWLPPAMLPPCLSPGTPSPRN